MSDIDWAAIAEQTFGHSHWETSREIIQAVMQPNARVAVKGCHSSSKPLGLDTPIPTPTGWTTMGEIKVGDLVFNEEGLAVSVVSLSPVTEKPCYRVTFCSGESIVASDDHLWSAIDILHRPRTVKAIPKRRNAKRLPDWRDHWDRAVEVTTAQMAESPKINGQNRWRIPLCRSLTGGEWPLRTPPYTFGAWLGDGTSIRADITCGEDDLEYMHAMIGGRVLRYPDRASTIIFGDRRYLDNPGLESGGKRIPSSALRSAQEHRLALLRGLMDTDGWVTVGCGVSIGQKSRDLALDIYELVVSLGWKASLRTDRVKLNGKECAPSHVVSFAPDICPFTLPRKVARWQAPGRNASRFTQRTVRSIEPVGVRPVRCIGVDSPRHLFLAGRDMIPTHNTYSISDAIILSLLAGGDVLTTAPTGSQVSGVLWPTIHRALRDCKLPTDDWTKNQTEIVLPDKHFAIGRSTDQGVRLQGYHAQPGSFLTIVVDEAPGVISEVMGAIEGMAAGGDVRVVILGNPIVPAGDFFEAFQGEYNPWTRFTIGAFSSPNFQKPDGSYLTLDELLAMDPAKDGPLDQNVRPYLITRRYVYDRFWRWGEAHPWWSGRILGDFPGQAIGSLLPLDWLKRAQRQEASFRKGVPITAGIDVAGAGEDETVVTLVQGDHILAEAVFPEPDPRGPVASYLLKWLSRGLTTVNVDKAGMGYYFSLHLRDVLPRSVVVRGINVGEGPISDPDELDPETGRPIDQGALYDNLKAQLYWCLRERFREGRVIGLADQAMVNQLASIQYASNRTGKTLIVSKKEMRRNGLDSPDRAESLMLAFAPPVREDPRVKLWGRKMSETVGAGVAQGLPDGAGGSARVDIWSDLYGKTIGESRDW